MVFLRSILKRPVLTNTVSVVILRGIGTFSRLLFLFIVARVTEPAVFGTVIFALTVVELGRIVADLGLDTLATREFAITADREARQRFAGTVLLSKLGTATLIYLLAAGYFLAQGDLLQFEIAGIAGLLIITGLVGNLPISYYQSQLRVRELVEPSVLVNGLALLCVGILGYLGAPVVAMVLVLPLADLVLAGVLFRRLVADNGVSLPASPLRTVAQTLRRSMPIAGTSILVTVYTRLDVFFLSQLYGAVAVGVYGLAFRVTEPFLLVSLSLSVSVYSHLSQTLARQPELVAPQARKYLVLVLAYGLASCLVLSVVTPPLIRQFLPDYSESVPIIQVLAVAVIFRSVNTCLTAIIQAHGRFAWVTGVAFFNLVTIVGTLVLLVPRYGALGAGMALLSGEVLNTLVQLWMVRPTLLQRPVR